MKISEAGIDLIKEFEGFSATPYLCPAGKMTVGYGHMLKKGEICDYVTEEIATQLLGEDLLNAENIVNANVTADLNQNQFDALVSFVYNVGAGYEGHKDGFVTLRSGRTSHMLTCLNLGDFITAADEFLKWDHAGGVQMDGLTRRRTAERELFIAPV